MMKWRAEPVHLCLYPFLSAASKYVEESGITLDNLIHTGTFRYARSRGKERIIEVNSFMYRLSTRLFRLIFYSLFFSK